MNWRRFIAPPATKAARNEGRKLLATTVNAVGLAVFVVGGLTPLLTRPFLDLTLVQFALALAIFGLAHMVAQRIVRRLED